jgi:hypothetical protein
MRYAKAMASAAIAALALTAFVGAASASASTFHSTVPNVALHGEQIGNHVFTIQGQKVTCETAVFTGNLEGTSSEHLRLHPVYEKCEAFGFPATVNTAGCLFNFNANTTLGGGTEAAVALESCTGGRMKLLISNGFATCEAQLPNQIGINGMIYINTLEDIDVSNISAHISVNVPKVEGPCPLAPEEGGTATYEALTTIPPASGGLEWRS